MITAHSRIYIGGVIPPRLVHFGADLGASAFAGQTWREIEGLEDLGRLRMTADPVRQSGSRSGPRATREKAARWTDTFEPAFALDASKPGQAALIAAEATADDYAFRIVLADGAERLFVAAVAGVIEVFGAPNDQPRLVAELWINSNVVRV
ncbi:MAG: hypothetical protein U1E34_00730 [Amaricoccus sp.]